MKTTGLFMNDPAVFLDNEELSAAILPKRGGKLASLFYKKTGMELLYQNRSGYFRDAAFGSDFSRFEACGFDDAFPGINAEEFTYNGQTFEYPDHGEIWSAAMGVTEMPGTSSADEVVLRYQSEYFNYSYKKTFRLNGRSLLCGYEIINNGAHDLPAFWTMHCLVNITPGMRFVFPDQVKTVRNVLEGEWLSVPDGLYSFPVAREHGEQSPQADFNSPSPSILRGACRDFGARAESRQRSSSPRAAHPRGAFCRMGKSEEFPIRQEKRLDALPQAGMAKYYVEGPCPEGEVGYDYPETGTKLRLSYDRQKLPYLGLWITNGGYRGEKNAALEPSSGFYDSLNNCRRVTGHVPVLRPKEAFCFEITLQADTMETQ